MRMTYGIHPTTERGCHLGDQYHGCRLATKPHCNDIERKQEKREKYLNGPIRRKAQFVLKTRTQENRKMCRTILFLRLLDLRQSYLC